MEFMSFKTKGQLAQELGISRETLRTRLNQIKGLNTGRRHLLFPRELKIIYKEFEESKN